MREFNVKNEKLSEMNDFLKSQFDEMIKSASEDNYISGISFVLQSPHFNGGNRIEINSGNQSKNGRSINEDSLFQMGSICKLFLSIVVLQLEQENKISLEDTIENYLGNEYPNWKNIKIIQLLNMTSQIPNFSNMDDSEVIQSFILNPSKIETIDEILDSVKDKELESKLWFYSNTNYMILAKIIKYITKKSVCEEIMERIFNFLDLKNTFYINHLIKDVIPKIKHKDLVSGYFYENEGKDSSFNGIDILDFSMSRLQAAGSIIATTVDINLFIKAIFEENFMLNTDQYKKLFNFIDQASGLKLLSGINETNLLSYSLGLEATYNPNFNTIVYGHTGGTFGFGSSMNYIPEKKLSYVYSFNTANDNNFLKIEKIVEKYIHKLFF